MANVPLSCAGVGNVAAVAVVSHLVVDGPLIPNKEERLVAVKQVGYRDRAADRAAELVPLERVDCLYAVDIAEIIRRVEGPVRTNSNRSP